MNEKPLIGLLCRSLTPKSSYESCEELPITLVKFTVKGINWKEKKIAGLVFENGQWRKEVTKFPQAVYNRRYTSSRKTTKALEKIIGKDKVFNTFTRFNKLKTFNILNQSELKDFLIPTYQYNSKVLLEKLAQERSIVIKPIRGTLGIKVYRIDAIDNEYKVYLETIYPRKTINNSKELINYIEKVVSPKKRLVIQPFISFATVEGRLFDMRMLVQKNRQGIWDVTADLSRVAYISRFITNAAYAIQPISEVLEDTEIDIAILTQLKEISIKTAKVLEGSLGSLGEISVDFSIDTSGKIIIIEVNGRPHKSLFEDLDDNTVKKIYCTPLQYAAYLANTD